MNSTLTQLLKKKSLSMKKLPFSSTPALKKNPQVKGSMTKITIMTPKKPNSAISQVAKMKLTNKKSVTASLPGSGHLCNSYSVVLIHGGSANDLPGVGYTVMSGVYDFPGLLDKKKRRSIYGASSMEGSFKHVSSCFSHLGF